MDLKASQTRTYDSDGFVKRAACLCFRSEAEEEVLLVSTKRFPDRWIVPGGGLEPEEEPGSAAVREVLEEAGVRGTLGRLLGIFENVDSRHRTYVFVLTVTEVLDQWEDSENLGRRREWFSIEEAIKVLERYKPVQAAYLKGLHQSRRNPGNGNAPRLTGVPDGTGPNSAPALSPPTNGTPTNVR